MLGQLQVLHDARAEQRERVPEGGEREAGAQLLGDGGAADEVAPLQDQGPQAGLGQVRSVDEAVVAAADDDGVVGVLGHLTPSFARG